MLPPENAHCTRRKVESLEVHLWGSCIADLANISLKQMAHLCPRSLLAKGVDVLKVIHFFNHSDNLTRI